jgi:serine/threonine-protein kinase
MVSLWTLAARVTGDESYSRWAELAAEDAWATQLEVTHLCCGAAGNAYGLLNLYRFTGDRVWLDRARTLTERAAAKALQGPSPSDPEPVHSLFRGDLGIAVLIADLERPDESAIPLYEAAR